MPTYTPDTIPFLQRGQPWPPKGELGVDRIRRYQQNERLFRGRHSEVFRDWVRLLREDQQATLELALNFPGAVSKLFSDLLFGEQPRFTAGAEGSDEQTWLDDLLGINSIDRLNYRAALAQSYRGDAVYKVRLEEGRDRAVIETIPASLWYPVADPDNATNIVGHVFAWEKARQETSRFGKTQTVRYLRAEIHLRGLVAQRLWRLEEDKERGMVIGERADLGLFYDTPPPEDQETGVDEPLVIHVPNLEVDDSPFGVDDYDEADTLFQELNVRLAQISRVLDKHTDPNMYGPPLDERNPTTGRAEARIGGRYFEVEQGQVAPGYMVWDAQLAANFQFVDRLLQGLYITTDTNAAAFSLIEAGSIPSGAALKRLLMRPLARTNRKRLYFDGALKRLFAIAARLEAANGRKAPGDLEPQILWRDGLPEDPMEAAQVEQVRTGNKATSSVRSAIRRLDGGSDEAIAEELAQIAADESAALPGFAGATAGAATGVAGIAFGETEE